MNMIEKVARAIATADERNGAPPYELVVQNKHSREFLYDQAKAAIEAMREPSRLVEYTVDRLFDFPPHAGHGKEYWQRMIDAALKEE